MGTKIQGNVFFPKNHPVIDLTGSTKDGFGSLHDKQITRTGQDPDSVMTRGYQNSYSVYSIENVRQTILSQESIFRNQLQELHRVYRRQQDLMNEIKMRNVKNVPVLAPDSVSNKHFEPSSNGIDRGLSLGVVLRSERTKNEPLFDGHAGDFQGRRSDEQFDTREFYPAKSLMLFGSSLVVPRNEIVHSQLRTVESLSKKRKLFGVEISEGNYDRNAASNLSTTLPRNDASNYVSFWKEESTKPYTEMRNHVEPSLLSGNHLLQNLEFGGKNVDTRLREDEKTDLFCKSRLYGGSAKEKCAESVGPGSSKGGLPWFLKNTQPNGETSKEVERPYFMNLDSLRNCSEQFFTKSETEIQRFTQKHELSAPIDVNEIKKDEIDSKNQLETRDLTYKSLRYQIDLNLSLDDEDVLLAPSLPPAVVKIATTETDLDAPPVIESEPEPDAPPTEADSRKIEALQEKSEISSEERDKIAADALICISLSSEKSKTDNDSCKLTEATLTDSLYWFAEVISSQCIDSSSESREDSVPEGMDYFEFMTLKLEDVKDKSVSYNNSTAPNVRSNEKIGQGGTICKGPRKRRTRQQKNFKRDILPGLVTLSRHEIKEDLKAFEEIRKGDSHLGKNKNSAKKVRGRRHSTSPSSAVSVPELRHLDGSLVGWGKRTKRLPRKRCIRF